MIYTSLIISSLPLVQNRVEFNNCVLIGISFAFIRKCMLSPMHLFLWFIKVFSKMSVNSQSFLVGYLAPPMMVLTFRLCGFFTFLYVSLRFFTFHVVSFRFFTFHVVSLHFFTFHVISVGFFTFLYVLCGFFTFLYVSCGFLRFM